METKERIRQIRLGDQAAFLALSEQYEPLLDRMSVRYASLSGEMSDEEKTKDFRQEAEVALYKAAMTFDLEQEKVTFGLYAKICIRNALISALRSERGEMRFGKGKPAEGTDERLTSENGDPQETVLGREKKRELMARAAEDLSPYEYRVFLGRSEGKKVPEIARETGRSVRSVHNALYRLRSKLRG